ncbi:MAG: TIGR02301 family protein [Alphaproteobacteria bacterium PA3]|nr:MAG: TIGR02301 family protein [Alphaproteobacteria bacterium PA3]
MKSRIWMAGALAVFAASGAALSVAQTAIQDPQNRGPTPTLETYEVPGAPLEPSRRDAATVVEDAPVDIPQDMPTDWNPDPNQDSGMADPYRPVPQKPRKALRNVEGIETEDNGYANPAADGQTIVTDNQRRARPIDPAKRADLTRLARVLGSLHALRVSCSGREDQTYRSRMSTLLDLEAPDASGLRDPLVDSFNAGFQAYGLGAATCPTDRSAQEAKLAKDGFRLAKQMAGLYRPITGTPETQPKQIAPQKAN